MRIKVKIINFPDNNILMDLSTGMSGKVLTFLQQFLLLNLIYAMKMNSTQTSCHEVFEMYFIYHGRR